MTEEASIQPKASPRSSFWKRMGIFLFFTFLLLLLFTGFGFTYYKWRHHMVGMLKKDRQLQSETVAQQIKQQSNINNLSQHIEQLELKLQKQNEKLDEIMLSEQGHFDRWRALESAYLVHVANDQLQFTNDLPLIIGLLQKATDILSDAESKELKLIQQSLYEDIAKFKSIVSPNITLVYNQLINLDNQIDQLPLLQLKATKKQEFLETIPNNLPWWKKGLYESLAILKKIVVVHKQEDSSLPFILPQEKTLLYRNLHAEMDNAIFGLLHRKASIYQTSLQRVMAWIEKYTDRQSPLTNHFLNELRLLKQQNIEPIKDNLDKTVAQFDHYLSQLPPART